MFLIVILPKMRQVFVSINILLFVFSSQIGAVLAHRFLYIGQLFAWFGGLHRL